MPGFISHPGAKKILLYPIIGTVFLLNKNIIVNILAFMKEPYGHKIT